MKTRYYILPLMIFLFGCVTEHHEPQSIALRNDDMSAKEPVRIVFEITPREQDEPLMQWLNDKQWCWGIEVLPTLSGQEIRKLRNNNGNVILHMHANADVRKRHNEYKGRPIPDVNEVLGKHIEAADGDMSKIIWLGLIENDSSGVGHSQELMRAKPKTYPEALNLIETHLAKAKETVDQFPGVTYWGLCGFATATHQFADSGVDCVIVERTNDDVDDLQTGIAFCRGAARQYNCEWGVDFSLWWGPIYGCIQNLPFSYHKRNMYLSYFSGARTFRIEGGHLFWDAGQEKLTNIASLLDEFGQFCMNIEAGRPQVPAAVMLPHDHGWMTPPYWRTTHEAWNYARLPYRQGHKGIDGFFGQAFPGSNFEMQPFAFGTYPHNDPPASPFALSCVTKEFAPSPEDVFYAEVPIPFGKYPDRDTARRDMEDNLIEPAPYRPLGDCRWGDIFDVLTDRVDGNVLKKYKVLILLGQIRLTEALKADLKAYVNQGGQLVCAAGVIGPDDSDLTGLELIGEIRVGRQWQWGDQAKTTAHFIYVPSQIQHEDSASILAQVDNYPVVVQNTIGKGRVYTCLVPWFEGENCRLAGAALRLMDEVIKPVQPVVVEGPPAQWLSSETENSYTVVIANHSPSEWAGKIIVRSPLEKFDRCTELLTGRNVSYKRKNQNVEAEVNIDPYDLAILRWER